jgi:hypothetical protein
MPLDIAPLHETLEPLFDLNAQTLEEGDLVVDLADQLLHLDLLAPLQSLDYYRVDLVLSVLVDPLVSTFKNSFATGNTDVADFYLLYF